MKCPGQDTQYWNTDAIFETECPECGSPMEFFKDDATRRCGNCRKKIVNPRMDFGCASYCKFAEQCLGTLPEDFISRREDLFKDRVAVEMKKYMGTDFKRIGHAAKVAGFAEKIGKKERADLPVILCAAYLYDIGAKNALKKYGSADSKYLEKESPIVAGELMEKLGAKEELVKNVVDMVSRRKRPGIDAGMREKILYDAGMLAHMSACKEKNSLDDGAFEKKLDNLFLTAAGRELAEQVLLKSEQKRC